ncbi:MAG: hypothetical protein AB7F22_07915 [Reyranella sp.]|uniref:hypothetical protein n=1 Tax=Reyranella sp. TaxID=1929291 RepID=UPI003D0C82A1
MATNVPFGRRIPGTVSPQGTPGTWTPVAPTDRPAGGGTIPPMGNRTGNKRSMNRYGRKRAK